MTDRTHYEILGVEPTATAAELKTAYRRAARATHPDNPNGTASAALFGMVSEAYECLADPGRRASYDYLLAHPSAPRQAPEPSGPRAAEPRATPAAAARPKPAAQGWGDLTPAQRDARVDGWAGAAQSDRFRWARHIRTLPGRRRVIVLAAVAGSVVVGVGTHAALERHAPGPFHLACAVLLLAVAGVAGLARVGLRPLHLVEAGILLAVTAAFAAAPWAAASPIGLVAFTVTATWWHMLAALAPTAETPTFSAWWATTAGARRAALWVAVKRTGKLLGRYALLAWFLLCKLIPSTPTNARSR